MRYGSVITLVSVLTLLQAVRGGKTCYEDEKLTAGGKCEPCEFCPSGQGIDLEVKILTNKDGDALECRPCKPCSAGYWNDKIYEQMACMMCRLNCSLLYRKEHRACGGSNSGQCGACINSLYEDRDNNIESPCVEKKTTQTKAIDVRIRTQKPGDIAKPVVSPDGRNKSPDISPFEHTMAILAGAICGAIAVITVVVAISYYLCKQKRSRESATPKIASSDDSMLSNGSSEMGEINCSNKTDLSKDDDLEVDSPLLDGDCKIHKHQTKGPRPELISCLPSSGPVGLTMTVEQETKKSHRTYPTFLLSADDAFIDLTSKLIYDEGKYKLMFRELGLSEQDLYAEYQYFFHQKHNYGYMIRRLLEKWLNLAGAGATFDVLCKALDDHEFHSVSRKLLVLYENPV